MEYDTLATSPCDLERAAALLDQIASFTESKSTLNEEQRVRLVKMAQELTFSLQTPMERILQHSWAELNNYINPTDPANGPFQFANNTSENWFEWAPKQGNGVFKDFSNHMGAYNSGRPKWVDPNFYPAREQLIDGFMAEVSDQGAVMLVDVGGSLGHDIELFLKQFPNNPGRLILQDLPDVIKQARSIGLSGKIELMEHDFFTEQPIKNARTYYLHSVLHDWPDFKAVEILGRLASAMRPGYSKVLIHENLIPDVDAHWQATALDLIMMGMVSSKERKENEWQHLIETAGLKIVKIWRPLFGAESLIECELVST
ncbi:hypothetical protein TrVFT333_005916 [Trichoderma virens FT-333]|nr:hypothetical protein TrVFT333_005916 [Trichoderma virens FT-333]